MQNRTSWKILKCKLRRYCVPYSRTSPLAMLYKNYKNGDFKDWFLQRFNLGLIETEDELDNEPLLRFRRNLLSPPGLKCFVD